MDFKGYYFDTIRLRNELMARLGAYLSMPSRLDELERKTSAMIKSTMLDVKANALTLDKRVKDLRVIVEARITSTTKLSNDILALKDTIEADPSLKKLLTGDTGLTSFALNALVEGKLTDYKPYLDKVVAYSRESVATLKDLEAVSTAMKTLTKNVEETYSASQGKGGVPPLGPDGAPQGSKELPIAAIAAGGAVMLGAAYLLGRRK